MDARVVRYSEILEVLGPLQFSINKPNAMAVSLLGMSVRDYAKLVGGFLLSILTGIALKFWYPQRWLAHDTIYALGDGFVVAGVIGVLLELLAYKFLIERVAGDIS